MSGGLTLRLSEIHLRDACILPDAATRTYYMIGSKQNRVWAYSSPDLIEWTGPQLIFQTPEDIWDEIPITGIWAPELHFYRGKYYLFLTFNTRHEFTDQWPDWRPRVTRGSAVLVSDAPTGPFLPLQNRSTPAPEMMTLDGTLWVEDGVPQMIYCHEWVQIIDGTVESIALTDDLSGAAGEPRLLFRGSDAPWNLASRQYNCHVTDGPFPFRSKSGKLLMIWSGFGEGGYTTGIAIADSGRLEGPWRQQSQPVYTEDGGHAMLFTSFEGQLMMALHSPNQNFERPRIFEMEDSGETLVLLREWREEP